MAGALALTIAVPAQESRPASAPVATLVVQNLTQFARAEGCAVVVPFARGVATDPPSVVVAGTPTAWQPFGARWPDGSLRQALCLFRTELAPVSERRLELVAGTPLTGPGAEIALPTCTLTLTIVQGGQPRSIELSPGAELERNALRRVVRYAGRVPEVGIVGEAIVTAWRDQEHAGVDLGLFFSDPTSKAMQCEVQLATLACQGRTLIVRNGPAFAVDTEYVADGSKTILLRDTHLGDGQGIRRSCVLLPAPAPGTALRDTTLRAAAVGPLLGGTDWRQSGAFGPFGFVPELPPWLPADRVRPALAARFRAFVVRSNQRGEPFATPTYGLQRQAGQTGDQEDFGVAKLGVVAATGLTSYLLEVEPSLWQEACRPVHFFETDGTPVQSAAHPKWVVWSGRTHWHCEVSTDRLGKPCPEPPYDTHGYTGKDRQHWSSNTLCSYYLLTGAAWARREIETEVQQFLAGETIAKELSTSGTDAPRAVGRTMLTASWLWLCTGDEALARRVHERCDEIYAKVWEGRVIAEGKVRTFSWENPDARMLDGKTPYWNPWQDALAAVGLEAAARTFGNANAKEIGRALARNVVRHGWKMDAKEVIVATAIRWLDGGEPPDPAALASGDKASVVWSYGTGFSMWALPALEVARQSAQELGDAALAARATELQRRVRATREVARDAWIDRFSEWDAVR